MDNSWTQKIAWKASRHSPRSGNQTTMENKNHNSAANNLFWLELVPCVDRKLLFWIRCPSAERLENCMTNLKFVMNFVGLECSH